MERIRIEKVVYEDRGDYMDIRVYRIDNQKLLKLIFIMSGSKQEISEILDKIKENIYV